MRSPTDSPHLRDFLQRSRGLRVLVVGDVMLDTYLSGDVERLSPEAPVPILRLSGQDHRLGGAGNAAANLASIGGRPTLIGVVGSDDTASLLRRLLRQHRTRPFLVVDPKRPTTEKTRAIARGQHLLRIDEESRVPVPKAIERRLIAAVRRELRRSAGVLVSDYGLGVVTDRLLGAVIRGAKARRLPVVVDGKAPDARRYRGATVFTPSHHDARAMTGRDVKDLADARRVATLLRRPTGSAVLLTLGPMGMLLRDKAGPPSLFRPLARSVYDATGAGDTVAAILTAGLALRLPLTAAVDLANRAAAVVVGKVGTATASPRELSEVA